MNLIKINLNYVDTLTLIGYRLSLNKNKFITTNEFYEYLKDLAKDMAMMRVLVIYPSKKVVSNELARLYKMGFLSRKISPRKVKTKSGKIANRGIQYKYSITRQGIKYMEYLLNSPSPKDKKYDALNLRIEEYVAVMKKNGVLSSLEEEMKMRKDIEIILRGLYKVYDKETDLFTPKNWCPRSHELQRFLEIKESIDMLNSRIFYDLKKDYEVLRKEYTSLKDKNTECEEKLSRYEKMIDELIGEIKKILPLFSQFVKNSK